MNKKPPQVPAFFDARTSYDLTLEQVQEALRQYTGLADGVVEFDVAAKTGKVRGATVRVVRIEIKG